MEQRPSLEANSLSSSQNVSHLLWNPMVHYRVPSLTPVCTSIYHAFYMHRPFILFELITLLIFGELPLGKEMYHEIV